LTDRTQCVKINDEISEEIRCNIGVPTPTEMPRTPKYKRCIAEKYGRARKGILSLLGNA
jgi:hypothetical protein